MSVTTGFISWKIQPPYCLHIFSLCTRILKLNPAWWGVCWISTPPWAVIATVWSWWRWRFPELRILSIQVLQTKLFFSSFTFQSNNISNFSTRTTWLHRGTSLLGFCYEANFLLKQGNANKVQSQGSETVKNRHENVIWLLLKKHFFFHWNLDCCHKHEGFFIMSLPQPADGFW